MGWTGSDGDEGDGGEGGAQEPREETAIAHGAGGSSERGGGVATVNAQVRRDDPPGCPRGRVGPSADAAGGGGDQAREIEDDSGDDEENSAGDSGDCGGNSAPDSPINTVEYAGEDVVGLGQYGCGCDQSEAGGEVGCSPPRKACSGEKRKSEAGGRSDTSGVAWPGLERSECRVGDDGGEDGDGCGGVARGRAGQHDSAARGDGREEPAGEPARSHWKRCSDDQGGDSYAYRSCVSVGAERPCLSHGACGTE